VARRINAMRMTALLNPHHIQALKAIAMRHPVFH
jgi:hypothetical protein